MIVITTEGHLDLHEITTVHVSDPIQRGTIIQLKAAKPAADRDLPYGLAEVLKVSDEIPNHYTIRRVG